MRSFLFVVLLSVAAVSASAQKLAVTRKVSVGQLDAQALQSLHDEMERVLENSRRFQMIEKALGGLAVTADKMELDESGKVVRASGNVRIRMNEVIITADDAVIENGDVRLGTNARVIIDYPVKMIQ